MTPEPLGTCRTCGGITMPYFDFCEPCVMAVRRQVEAKEQPATRATTELEEPENFIHQVESYAAERLQEQRELARLRALVGDFLSAYANKTETGFKERCAAIDALKSQLNPQ